MDARTPQFIDIYACYDALQAARVVGLLESNGLLCRVIDFTSSFLPITIGKFGEKRVAVPHEQVVQAKQLLGTAITDGLLSSSGRFCGADVDQRGGADKRPGRIVAGLLLLVTVAVAASCTRQGGDGPAAQSGESASVGANVGSLAPTVTFQSLSGSTIALESLRGKVVLVNFWATWCGPCLMEMPSMQRLYTTFPREEFEILAVSSDFEGAQVVKPYVDRLRLTFPILLDPQYEVTDQYQVTGIPTSILIDRDGVITHKFFGSRDWDAPDAHKLINQLLQAQA